MEYFFSWNAAEDENSSPDVKQAVHLLFVTLLSKTT
jgi:hypothetical protein